MQKNSFTSSFNRLSGFYILVLIIGFYGTFLVSATLFLCKPHLFYWRAWEFFHEIVYNTPECNIHWEGDEKGDISRRFFLVQQQKWPTRVSCDPDGFRSVPFHVDQYPILIVGDSQIWGSGLSDNETLPWKLAEKLKLPVFNGSKSTTEKLKNKQSTKNAKLIIEAYQSSILSIGNFRKVFEKDFSPQPYQACRTKSQIPLSQAFTPKRYFIPFKFMRFLSIENIAMSLKLVLNSERRLHLKMYDNGKTLEDLDYVVSEITKRANTITSLGHKYLYIPVPMQQAIMSKEISSNTIWWESELIRRLNANGVHAINLLPLFLAHRDEGLYFETDSHWNARGVELALTEIIPYLEKNNLIPLEFSCKEELKNR